MKRKNSRNTKNKIVDAAWELFYKQGYDDTTIEEIVDVSGTSKGSFYHYFNGKDALLGSLSDLFDNQYKLVVEEMDVTMHSFDKLMHLNEKLFDMIDKRIAVDLLAKLYSSQLVTQGQRHLMDNNRIYYKLLRQIIIEGQEKGELRDDVTVNEFVKAYALCERGLIYDWCISNGDYSLCRYGQKMMPLFLYSFKKV